MSFKITFRFEGLFTFVVRRKQSVPEKNGVYVLLATNSPPLPNPHPHHPIVEHLWHIKVDGEKSVEVPEGTEYNLRDRNQGQFATGSAPRIENLLPYSRVTGKPVDKNLLENPLPLPELHGRMVLPLHSLTMAEDLVDVEWAHPQNGWIPVGRKTGVTLLSYVANGPIRLPDSAGTVISRSSFIKVTFLPKNAYKGPHKDKEDLGHAHQHASVFKVASPPKFRLRGDWEPDLLDEGGKGIDPVMCTNAGGCDPDDPLCVPPPPDDPDHGEG